MADSVLIVVHVGIAALYLAGAIDEMPRLLRIDRDWGSGEILNYVKWLILAGSSVLLFRRQRQPIYLAIIILAVVALLDDSLQFHERFAASALPSSMTELGLPQATRELVFMALEGSLIGVALIYGWFRTSRPVRRQAAPILLLAVGAAFCAAAVDFLHSLAPNYSILAGMLGILEDGGEMMFLSLMAAYAMGLLDRTRNAVA